METGAPFVKPPTVTPGLGRGWMRVARAIADTMPCEEIARIWIFHPLRTDGREWGTAVIARRVGEDRVTVTTARYMMLTRGKKRGQSRVEVEEVGESPADVVDDVVRGVQARAGETDPPVEIEPVLWFGGEDDESATGS